MLREAGGSKEMIDRAAEQAHGLGYFIRSLVGLDREAVSQAFNQFVSRTTATPDQIEFIELIVQELTQAGVMDTERLYQSPFIDINPLGPDEIFPSAVVDQLFKVISEHQWLLRGRPNRYDRLPASGPILRSPRGGLSSPPRSATPQRHCRLEIPLVW